MKSLATSIEKWNVGNDLNPIDELIKFDINPVTNLLINLRKKSLFLLIRCHSILIEDGDSTLKKTPSSFSNFSIANTHNVPLC